MNPGIRLATRSLRALGRAACILACAVVLASSVNVAFANDAKTAAANKALVLEFYQRMFGDKDISAIDQYLSENYIQHNPKVPTGRAAVKQLFGDIFAKMPNLPKTKVDVRRAAAEGDLVWLHVRTVMPDGQVNAIVDIFRVEGGRIVEHWDVVQPVPEKAANDNGMF